MIVLFGHTIETVQFLCKACIYAVYQPGQIQPVVIVQALTGIQTFLQVDIYVGREYDGLCLLALLVFYKSHLIIIREGSLLFLKLKSQERVLVTQFL